jgi:Flp pilus assembly pilin Flp
MLQRFSLFVGRAFTFSLEDLRREDGQTTLEYAVVTAVVVVMAIGAAALFTGAVTTAVGKITSAINTIVP